MKSLLSRIIVYSNGCWHWKCQQNLLSMLELIVICHMVRLIQSTRLPTGHTHEDIACFALICWDTPCLTLKEYKDNIIDNISKIPTTMNNALWRFEAVLSSPNSLMDVKQYTKLTLLINLLSSSANLFLGVTVQIFNALDRNLTVRGIQIKRNWR